MFAEESQLQTIGEKSFSESGIEEIVIPHTVVTINNKAFCECKALKKVTFADGSLLQTIGEQCFSGSGIEEITLPSALEEIDETAFKDCDSLKTVWVEKKCKIKVKEYVPKGAKVKRK